MPLVQYQITIDFIFPINLCRLSFYHRKIRGVFMQELYEVTFIEKSERKNRYVEGGNIPNAKAVFLGEMKKAGTLVDDSNILGITKATPNNYVVVTNFKMPFDAMVVLFFKATLAFIPSGILIGIVSWLVYRSLTY